MSCNCSSTPTPVVPVNPELPPLGTPAELCCPQDPCLGNVPASITGSPVSCSSGNNLTSSASPGTTLDSTWTDALGDHNGEGVTLLGRIGRKLAKVLGNGFLQIRDGKAFVVTSVALKVTDVWHQWVKLTGINRRPVIGDALPFTYQIIGDANGQLHGIQGLVGDLITCGSVHVWNKDEGLWETKETADIPIERRGLAPRVTALELTGFEPISAQGSATTVRELSVLSGSGIIVVNQQATIPSSCDCEGCEPEAALASVATFLPFPTSEDEAATFSLKWTVEDGPHWVED